VPQCGRKNLTDCHSSRPERAKALTIALEKEFGVPFTLFDAATGAVIPLGRMSRQAQGVRPVSVDAAEVQMLARSERTRVATLPDGRYQLALVLYAQREAVFVAAAEVTSLARAGEIPRPAKVREQAVLEKWLQAVSDRLRLEDQLLSRHRAEAVQRAETSSAWETLLTLDQVARDLRIHKHHSANHLHILEAAHTSLRVRTLIWIHPEMEEPVLCQGERLLTQDECRHLARVLSQSRDFQPSAPLLCNNPPATRWGAHFPQIENLMAFAPTDQGPGGWFIALNKIEPVPFRLTDAAILLPFVALLDMQRRSTHRYLDLKELLVGLARALTTSLEAKDHYTFGHSERVARIAVELGRELRLNPTEVGDLYLAGLLHDVGKIGIRDSVLQKTEALSADEQKHIQEHVTIGYAILADLRQIRNLLPGVLYHHERYDGSGYPDGLACEDIPLLARILAVADAYDAMSHPRPYRDAMPNRQVEQILLAGAGSQWDKRVVDAFCRCRQQVYAIRQRGVGDSLRLAIEGAVESH
jgi:HD-GYP domain-containing protein (c-di-GMP phosphodiesterase class II)